MGFAAIEPVERFTSHGVSNSIKISVGLIGMEGERRRLGMVVESQLQLGWQR